MPPPQAPQASSGLKEMKLSKNQWQFYDVGGRWLLKKLLCFSVVVQRVC